MQYLSLPSFKQKKRLASVADHPLSPGGETYAVLDANVLLPPRLSDVLFDLQQTGIYHPRWTEKIEQEFVLHWGHIVKGLKGAALKAYKAAAPHADDEKGARQRLRAYRGAVGDEYELLGYDAQHIVQRVPKKVNCGDTHVVAAAILLKTLLASEGSASDRVFIVSNNTKHLAVTDVAMLGIEVVKPGVFIDMIAQADAVRMKQALDRTISALQNPPYTKSEILGALQLHGANATVAQLCHTWGVSLTASSKRKRQPKP